MNFSVSNKTNITRKGLEKPLACLSDTTYEIIAGFTAPLTVFGICIYLRILWTFHRHPRLINHFTVHIISLSIINILNSLAYWPQTIARAITTDWLSHPFVCAQFQYFVWVMPVTYGLQEIIICGDRWTAFMAPVFYNTHKSVRWSLCGTIAVVIWMHGWYLPLGILNYVRSLSYPKACDGMVPGYPTYRIVVYFMVAYIPQGITYGSYPFLLLLLFRRRFRRRLARGRVEIVSIVRYQVSSTSLPPSVQPAIHSDRATPMEIRNTEDDRRKAIVKQEENANNQLVTGFSAFH
ncbi:hypothetical protein BV898_06012 [Hypsibius exemplaris]|uniref:G-protein coupled receptors family 1 profile domain-containing protein n=1 Tax=Hypsibius exemplaris TaxID=2072580 RepID=A0A1W0WXS9_HYPEX|nr:hypothetical protein BV898_06012 [Hypsibius exemplaris]